VPELSFKDRLQDLFDRGLYDAIFDGGDAQGSELPGFASFRDQLSSTWARTVTTFSQFSSKSVKKRRLSFISADTPHRLPVDTWRAFAFVGGNALPGAPQIAGVGKPSPQLTILLVGMLSTPLVQLPLHAE